MKRLFLAGILALIAGPAFADHEIKVAIDRGTYPGTASVNGSSSTGTAFFSADAKRMDGIAFNNSPDYIYLGTTSVALHGVGVTHENLRIGVPVPSSGTFKLDGIMSDALYFTCKAGQSSCNVRVMETKNR